MSGAGRAAPATGRRHAERSAARLAAVQAVYQIEIAGADAEDVVGEFVRYRFGGSEEGSFPRGTDREFFAVLVKGACARRAEVDDLISGALADGWTLDRLEILLKTVLRVGAFEMLDREDVPARVVINEYVEVARAFFERGEPGMVNAVLDRLAHDLRAAEFTAAT